MKLRRRLTVSFLTTGLVYLLGTLLSLLTSISLARLLGPEGFGQYALVMAWLALAALPVVAGIPQLITREVASYSQSRNWGLYRGVFRAANVWVIFVSGILLGAYFLADWVGGWFYEKGKWSLLGIVILLLPIRGFNAIRNGAIRGLGFPSLSELPGQVMQPLVLLMLIVILISFDDLTVRMVLTIQVAAGVITLVAATVLYRRVRPSTISGYTPLYQCKAWSRALLPFTLMGMLGTLSTQVGVVVLGFLGTDEGVAAFRVAERGAHVTALSLVLVNMVIAPSIVRVYKEGDVMELQRLSRRTARGAFVMTLLLATGLVVLGKPIIDLVFGVEYVDIAYLPMVVLVLGQLVNVAFGSVGLLLSMSGHERLTLLGQFAGLVTIVVLALLLIPKYNELGAAIAAAGGLVVWNCVLGFAVARRLKIRPGIF
jgi:O-antigen/teichoic acid export membrane protein